MRRQPFKKLLLNCKMNAVSQDEHGNWTKISSSNNKRRMDGVASSVGGKAGEQAKQWIPSKLLINEDDLESIWNEQQGLCYWFKVPLDLNLLYRDHPDWHPKHPLAPSVDKIDVDGDYSIDNVVICSRFANFGRQVYPFDKMRGLIDFLVSGSLTTRTPYDRIFHDIAEYESQLLASFDSGSDIHHGTELLKLWVRKITQDIQDIIREG